MRALASTTGLEATLVVSRRNDLGPGDIDLDWEEAGEPGDAPPELYETRCALLLRADGSFGQTLVSSNTDANAQSIETFDAQTGTAQLLQAGTGMDGVSVDLTTGMCRSYPNSLTATIWYSSVAAARSRPTRPTGFPLRVRYCENGRLMTEYRLEDLVTNVAIPDGSFTFSPPEGAHVSTSDWGYEAVTLHQVEGIVGYRPLVATKPPAGFTAAPVDATAAWYANNEPTPRQRRIYGITTSRTAEASTRSPSRCGKRTGRPRSTRSAATSAR